MSAGDSLRESLLSSPPIEIKRKPTETPDKKPPKNIMDADIGFDGLPFSIPKNNKMISKPSPLFSPVGSTNAAGFSSLAPLSSAAPNVSHPTPPLLSSANPSSGQPPPLPSIEGHTAVNISAQSPSKAGALAAGITSLVSLPGIISSLQMGTPRGEGKGGGGFGTNTGEGKGGLNLLSNLQPFGRNTEHDDGFAVGLDFEDDIGHSSASHTAAERAPQAALRAPTPPRNSVLTTAELAATPQKTSHPSLSRKNSPTKDQLHPGLHLGDDTPPGELKSTAGVPPHQSTNICLRWVRQFLHPLLTFLESFFLHLYACALTAYRWIVPFLPALFVCVCLATVGMCRIWKPLGRDKIKAALARFGWTTCLLLGASEGVGIFLLGVSIASLPLGATLLLQPAMDFLTFPVKSTMLSAAVSPEPKMRLRLGALCVFVAFLVTLANGFSNDHLPSLWVQDIAHGMVATHSTSAIRMPIAASFVLGGVVFLGACGYARWAVVARGLETAIDDEYYAHERERQAKEAAKKAGRQSTPLKPKPTSTLNLKMANLNLDIGFAELQLVSSSVGYVVVLALSLLAVFFVQGLVAAEHVELPTVTVNAADSGIPFRFISAFECAFAGGGPADGNAWKNGDAAITGSVVTERNYCALSVPSLLCFVVVGFLVRKVSQRLQSAEVPQFYEAYPAKTVLPSAEAAAAAPPFLSRCLASKLFFLPSLYFVATLVSSSNPVSQQASPTSLHAFSIADAIALALLAAAVIVDAWSPIELGSNGTKPPRLPHVGQVLHDGPGEWRWNIAGGVVEETLPSSSEVVLAAK